MSKIAVVGSRNFTDLELVNAVLDEIIQNDSNITIISGGARGADTLAEIFADTHHLPKIIIVPEWKRLGKRAGFVRNQVIVDEADMVIAFWDGKSKGTESTIRIAKNSGKPIRVIRVDKKENEW